MDLLAFELEKIKNDPDLDEQEKEELIEIEKKKYRVLAPSLEYKQKLKEDEIRNKEEELKKKQYDLEIEYDIKLFEEYINLEKRVFNLIDQMPESLKEKIEIFLSTFKTPSQEDVDFAM